MTCSSIQFHKQHVDPDKNKYRVFQMAFIKLNLGRGKLKKLQRDVSGVGLHTKLIFICKNMNFNFNFECHHSPGP